MKRLYFMLFIVIMLACNNNDQTSNHDESDTTTIIKSLQPSVYNALFVFIKGSNDSTYCLKGEKLLKVYKSLYATSYSTYESFVHAASKGQVDSLMLNVNGLVMIRFYIDGDVKEQYIDKHSIREFLNKYCNQYNSKLVVKKEYSSNRNKVFSILYYAFINNYKVLQDDYRGSYIIRH